ncbi:metal-dependent transcriptional regulator [Ruminococcus sp. NK3A76]|uniref:metal-dependent transcriptional regulator n=1 Tax=Ruminococcus sp. NK3A76 TaxID=877411 RepID=UPI00048EB74D|nr:metal-dependent transcriptional regulator [Ruminococcus sp. NK3A76]
MSLRKSGEDYLEAILVIGKRKAQVRSIDVANELGFSKPSVSRAVSLLKEGGFITVEKDGSLLLTDVGREKAEDVYGRHCLLTEFFKDILHVSEENAAEDACQVEHVISAETYNKLTDFVKKYNKQ